MHIESNMSASAGFRHLKRTLDAGEAVPRVPSLFEQLSACARGKLAADSPAESDDTAVAAIEPDADEE
jgi:hypothetical protein